MKTKTSSQCFPPTSEVTSLHHIACPPAHTSNVSHTRPSNFFFTTHCLDVVSSFGSPRRHHRPLGNSFGLLNLRNLDSHAINLHAKYLACTFFCLPLKLIVDDWLPGDCTHWSFVNSSLYFFEMSVSSFYFPLKNAIHPTDQLFSFYRDNMGFFVQPICPHRMDSN